MKKILFLLFACLLGTANAEPLNIAYVEVNSNNLDNVGCYVRSDNNKPIFHIATIFAANVNGSSPNKPIVYFNPQVDNLLNHTNQVQKLQAQGIKVVLTILGNHENAGWACMTNLTDIQTFADQIVDVANKYHLDGIDIDDEYSTCTPNDTSILKIARAIKTNPKFKGKILTKDLFSDYSYFAAKDLGNKLADYLDYGSEMSYGYNDYSRRLTPYVLYGMAKNKLLLGFNSNDTFPANAVSFIELNGYQGAMHYDITNDALHYLNELAKAEYDTSVTVLPNCLH